MFLNERIEINIQFFHMSVTLTLGLLGSTFTLFRASSKALASLPMSLMVEWVNVLTSMVNKSFQAFFMASKA